MSLRRGDRKGYGEADTKSWMAGGIVNISTLSTYYDFSVVKTIFIVNWRSETPEREKAVLISLKRNYDGPVLVC